MYFYSFLADYDCDTVLCSKQKWNNDELLDILKEFRNRPNAKNIVIIQNFILIF